MRERLIKFWEPVALVAALATIPALYFEASIGPEKAFWLNLIIWLVFTGEFVSVLAVCKTRKERIEWVEVAWVDILIIMGSFPFLPASFQAVRLVRLIRVLRVARLFVLARLLRFLGHKFALHPLVFTGFAVLLAVFIGANGLLKAEPEVVPELSHALWWALTTVTTVGYGDISPATPQGRLVGGLLMLIGTAVTASFSAGLAAYFLSEQDNVADKEDVEELKARLERLERLLENLNQKS